MIGTLIMSTSLIVGIIIYCQTRGCDCESCRS